jgi:rhomboid domain-containing protein 1
MQAEAISILLSLALLMIYLYFGNVPLPDTSVDAVDYILRTFYHADLLHLLSNMLVLARVSVLGELLTPGKLIQLLLFLTITSSIFLLAIDNLFGTTRTITVGFSGVLFGLIVVKNVLLGADITTVLTDLALLILPGILDPQISFLGHLSGIIAGFIYLFIFERDAAHKCIGIAPTTAPLLTIGNE